MFPWPAAPWFPSGNYWDTNPRNWRLNTALAVGAGIAGAIVVFKISIDNERRFSSTEHARHPIPSQRWCKHALEDDPLYPQEWVELKEKNKVRPPWKRMIG
jgi:hypothetical protein